MAISKTFKAALEVEKYAEDFICAVADNGDPKTGSIDDMTDEDVRAMLQAIILQARHHQQCLEKTRSALEKEKAQRTTEQIARLNDKLSKPKQQNNEAMCATLVARINYLKAQQ